MAEPRKAVPRQRLPSGHNHVPPQGLPAKVAISPARAAAFAILERVGRSTAHSDDLLHGPGLVNLSQADKDLTTTLVLGVLRWQIALDARIRPLLSRPDASVPLAVELALRMGAFQLNYLDRVPAHAALNESVEQVRVAGQPQAAGMVNAVLRKLVGMPITRRPLVEPVAEMAERLGHPAWLVEGWVHQYGRAEAEAICEFDQKEPGCATIFAEEAGSEGLPLMDAGSRLVAELAAAAVPKAKRVWDCCAAPGGKTLVLRHRLPAAELLATDVSAKRLGRLRGRLDRVFAGNAVKTAVADATELAAAEGDFDLILCDVPCSGTGTLARNPEIRHRLRGEELRRQAERQVRLLRAALGRLSPGGRLLYSTCSLEAEECEEVLKSASGVKNVLQVPLLPAMERLREQGVLREGIQGEAWLREGALRTLPGANFEGDGFFAALFERE